MQLIHTATSSSFAYLQSYLCPTRLRASFKYFQLPISWRCCLLCRFCFGVQSGRDQKLLIYRKRKKKSLGPRNSLLVNHTRTTQEMTQWSSCPYLFKSWNRLPEGYEFRECSLFLTISMSLFASHTGSIFKPTSVVMCSSSLIFWSSGLILPSLLRCQILISLLSSCWRTHGHR